MLSQPSASITLPSLLIMVNAVRMIVAAAPRRRHVAAFGNNFVRPTFFYGAGGVGLALGAVEGLIAGCAQMYIARSKESMREKCGKVDVDSSQVTELARKNAFLIGMLRAVSGAATFIVGGMVSKLAELSVTPMKRAMCICWSLWLLGQTAVSAPLLQGDWSDKAKKAIQGQASIYGKKIGNRSFAPSFL